MRAKTHVRRTKPKHPDWQTLSCDDLEGWTDEGSLKRGKTYFTSGQVQSLALTKAGELVAWVQGTERYAVRVAVAPLGETPRLLSLCSCPVGYGCKHAVAAVLAYFDAIARGKQIPEAHQNDPRRLAAAGTGAARNDDYEPSDLRAIVSAMTHKQLVELVMRMAEQLVNVRDGLDECARLIIDPHQDAYDTNQPPLSARHSPRVYRG